MYYSTHLSGDEVFALAPWWSCETDLVRIEVKAGENIGGSRDSWSIVAEYTNGIVVLCTQKAAETSLCEKYRSLNSEHLVLVQALPCLWSCNGCASRIGRSGSRELFSVLSSL